MFWQLYVAYLYIELMIFKVTINSYGDCHCNDFNRMALKDHTKKTEDRVAYTLLQNEQ